MKRNVEELKVGNINKKKAKKKIRIKDKHKHKIVEYLLCLIE